MNNRDQVKLNVSMLLIIGVVSLIMFIQNEHEQVYSWKICV